MDLMGVICRARGDSVLTPAFLVLVVEHQEPLLHPVDWRHALVAALPQGQVLEQNIL